MSAVRTRVLAAVTTTLVAVATVFGAVGAATAAPEDVVFTVTASHTTAAPSDEVYFS